MRNKAERKAKHDQALLEFNKVDKILKKNRQKSMSSESPLKLDQEKLLDEESLNSKNFIEQAQRQRALERAREQNLLKDAASKVLFYRRHLLQTQKNKSKKGKLQLFAAVRRQARKSKSLARYAGRKPNLVGEA